MEQKPYGKLTDEQLKRLTADLHNARNLESELQAAMQEADPEKLKSKLGNDFSWVHYYEKPFHEHITWGILILGWQDDLKAAAQSDDPQQTFLDFIDNLDSEAEWQGGFQGKFEDKHLFAVVISIFKTMKSIMVYQKSLSTLVEEVREGNEKALFNAVRIDRTMVACPSILHRIGLAEFKGDKKFFIHLRNALKGPSKKPMVALEELRYMLTILVEAGAEKLSNQNLEDLLVEKLKLYPSTPGAQKNLRRFYSFAKKFNSLK